MRSIQGFNSPRPLGVLRAENLPLRGLHCDTSAARLQVSAEPGKGGENEVSLRLSLALVSPEPIAGDRDSIVLVFLVPGDASSARPKWDSAGDTGVEMGWDVH